ncbi:MAG: hypothetical protein KA735_12435 [Burkholderiaceae bacterium]|nr:hypothetical protein [Burkholderiaceae bacterium]
MLGMVGSISGTLHVLQDAGLPMAIMVVVVKACSLISTKVENWFWEILTCCFVALLYKYGQAWCLHVYHGYPLSMSQLTKGESWTHLIVAFWSGLGGGVVGWTGWTFVANKNRWN